MLWNLIQEGEDQTFLVELLDDPFSSIRLAALGSLRHYSGGGIESRVTPLLASPDSRLQQTAQLVLAGRLEWARTLLARVSSGEVHLNSIHPQTLTILLRYEDRDLQETLQQLWGDLRQSEADLQLRMGEVRRALAEGTGNVASGAVHFQEQCASCHRFKGQGREVGPDLDGYELDNLESLIPAIVHPNLGIREGFETAHLGVSTQDGGVTLISGFVLQEEDAAVRIRDLDGRVLTLPRGTIHSLRLENTSIMPEGLLDSLDEAAIRDLFAYLGAPNSDR